MFYRVHLASAGFELTLVVSGMKISTRQWRVKYHMVDQNLNCVSQGFQSGPVPGTFTRLRSCIVPVEITEPPKISGGQNHKYDGR
jgi:hypothetical protein